MSSLFSFMLNAIVCLGLLFMHSAHANDIWGKEAGFMEDETSASLMRHRAQQRAKDSKLSSKEVRERDEKTAECGSLNVGNVDAKDSKRVENIVFIRGDVINANNNCN